MVTNDDFAEAVKSLGESLDTPICDCGAEDCHDKLLKSMEAQTSGRFIDNLDEMNVQPDQAARTLMAVLGMLAPAAVYIPEVYQVGCVVSRWLVDTHALAQMMRTHE